jgi:hypothetical protein
MHIRMRSLKLLKDDELLKSTQALVQRERECLTQILRHLQEIERRKLFSDLRCGSLFEYAVRVLGYSEAAAGRRIAAMRLMREIPEVAEKIESGALNLAKLCQAQTFFRGVLQAEPQQKLNTERKKEVLALIEEKTTRQAEKILLEMGGNKILPREQMKAVSAEHTEVRFLIDETLREKLAEVRSLLGPKGGHLGLAELMLEMATLAADRLAEKKFGKRRVQGHQAQLQAQSAAVMENAKRDTPTLATQEASRSAQTARPPVREGASVEVMVDPDHSGAESESLRRTRYVSRATRHAVWQASAGRCTHCGSRHDLELDHVEPFALGGDSREENLRLLCRSCNLRRGVKTYGASTLRR